MLHLGMWMLVGLVVGILGSWATGTLAWDGAVINVAVTILGAALATSLVRPLPGARVEPGPAPRPELDATSLVVALVGGVVVLAVVHLVRRSVA